MLYEVITYGSVVEPKENQDSLYQAALETAKKADLILFVGGLNKDHHQDCEGGDRLSYDLPFNQNALLKDIININPNTAVILVSGNAVPWQSRHNGAFIPL